MRRRLLTLLFVILGSALGAPAVLAQPREGGEAALKLSDLSQVTFLSLDGHTLLLIGLVSCFLGPMFGLVIYMQLKNLPVHRSRREISELIYETCKTYLITQGKFIMILRVFIAVIVVAYFGVLRPVPGKSVALTVPMILLFSLVGIAGSYENRRRTLEKDSLEPSLTVAPHITYLRTTPAAGTQSGGATTHTLGFINAAVELGAHLSVITNDRIAGLDEAKVLLKLIEPDPLGLTRPAFDLRNGLLFTERACAEIARQPPDLIYQRYSRFNWTGVEASLRTRRPLFLEYNGSEVWMAKHWGRLRLGDLLERCERLNLAAATRVFVVADVERNNLIKAGVAPDKIVVNPNGVDVDKFRPGVGGAAVRRELGVAEDEMLVGFVGTFGPWHGVLRLAEAITLMPVDCGVRFLLVGSGMFREEVERIIRAAGKERQVIFTGHVEHERVPALLDACDILLSPHVPLEDGSEFFGSPTKLFEYMAMGKGIVASRLGQIGDVLSDQETALLTEPGNARQLADAILQLSGSPELRHRLGAAARQAAIERHTWKRNAGRVLESYRDWIEGRRET